MAEKCNRCINGTITEEYNCPYCNNGRVTKTDSFGKPYTEPCTECRGSGKRERRYRCPYCGGSGYK